MTNPHHRPARTIAGGATALTLAMAGVLLAAQPAAAAEYTVTNTADSGAGSLRQAILDANTVTPGELDSIVITATGTITLLSTLPVTDGVQILGPGSADLTITRASDIELINVTLAAASATDFALADVTLNGAGDAYGSRGLTVTDSTLATSNVTLDNTEFINFIGANQGGAALVDGTTGTVSVIDSLFEENSSTLSGGALALTGIDTAVVISGSTFEGNAAQAAGGAVFIGSAGSPTVSITDTRFFENSSVDDGGGAVFSETNGDMTVTDSTFDDNTASDGAGALLPSGSTSLFSTQFIDNRSLSNRGGAILIGNNNNLDVYDSSFIDNSAQIDGGAIMIFNGAGLAVFDSLFVENTAQKGGAIGVELYSSQMSIERSAFIGNVADSTDLEGGFGGALSFTSLTGLVTIYDSTFDGNAALRDGTTGGRGGAFYADGIAGGFLAYGSTFTNHSLGTIGGAGVAFYVGQQYVDGFLGIRNSTFVEPAADPEKIANAVFYIDGVETDGEFSVENTTITSNYAVHIRDNDNGNVSQVRNTLFDADPAADIFSAGGDPLVLEWSMTTTAADPGDVAATDTVFGVADLKLGPLQNNGGVTDTRMLLAGSPAIDAGDPAFASPPDFDQRGDGFPRVIHARVDIGAIEVPFVLPPTGQGVNLWVPVGGGILLLLGVGAIVFAKLRGQGSRRAR